MLVFGQLPTNSGTFYRAETARRVFFDRFSVSGEITYNKQASITTGTTQSTSTLNEPRGSTATSTPVNGIFDIPEESTSPVIGSPFGLVNNLVGLRFRVDYALLNSIDLSVFFDASEQIAGTANTFSLSWIAFKYFGHTEGVDYAFRIAVDPARDGDFGFRQTDVGLLLSGYLSPIFSSDLAIGLRRIGASYTTFFPDDPANGLAAFYDKINIRGNEFNILATLNMHVGVSDSRIFSSLYCTVHNYDIIAQKIPLSDLESIETSDSIFPFAGPSVTIAARFGFQLSRPAYQLAPFIGIPIASLWEADNHLNVGLRLTFR